MDHRRDALAPSRPHVARDSHETAGIGVNGIDVEHLGRPLLRDHGSKRHELSAAKPLIEEVVRFSQTRIGKDRTGAESTWPIFHAPGVDRADLAASETLRGGLNRIARDASYPVDRRKDVVGLLAVIAAQVNIAQTASLRKPPFETVPLEQIGEGAADRQSVVTHRREYKNFVDVELFGQHAIEAYVGKDAASYSKVARGILPQQTPHRNQHGIFQHLLNRGGDVLAPTI